MGRKSVEINPECGKRLKQICYEQGITQTKLAELIHLSKKTVSHMVTGKSGISKESAQAIITLFPEYRLEWILGIDDVKYRVTMEKQEKREYELLEKHRKKLISAIITLTQGSNLEIKPDNDGIVIRHIDPSGNGYDPILGKLILDKGITNRLIGETEDFIRNKVDSIRVDALNVLYGNILYSDDFLVQDNAILSGGSTHDPQEQ